MSRYTDLNEGIKFISVSFGDDEAKALEFADRHWDRVQGIRYIGQNENGPVQDSTSPFRTFGWTVFYYQDVKADADSINSNSSLGRKTVQKSRRG